MDDAAWFQAHRHHPPGLHPAVLVAAEPKCSDAYLKTSPERLTFCCDVLTSSAPSLRFRNTNGCMKHWFPKKIIQLHAHRWWFWTPYSLSKCKYLTWKHGKAEFKTLNVIWCFHLKSWVFCGGRPTGLETVFLSTFCIAESFPAWILIHSAYGAKGWSMLRFMSLRCCQVMKYFQTASLDLLSFLSVVTSLGSN